MITDITFEELVYRVCTRPGMWVAGGTFNEAFAFIMGYAMGNGDTPLSGENWRIFNEYVCIKLDIPKNYASSYAIAKSTNSDKEALQLFEATMREFADLRRRMTADELLAYAAANFQ